MKNDGDDEVTEEIKTEVYLSSEESNSSSADGSDSENDIDSGYKNSNKHSRN
jgi:hypothetical protein